MMMIKQFVLDNELVLKKHTLIEIVMKNGETEEGYLVGISTDDCLIETVVLEISKKKRLLIFGESIKTIRRIA